MSFDSSPQVHRYQQPQAMRSLDQKYPYYRGNREREIATSYQRPFDQYQEGYPPPPVLNRYGQSQIETVFAPISQYNSQVRQDPMEVNRSANNYGTSQPQRYQRPKDFSFLKQQRYQVDLNQKAKGPPQRLQGRFENYQEPLGRPYKYNAFSMVDEPWNRCCEGESCDNLAGNQCIAGDPPSSRFYIQ